MISCQICPSFFFNVSKLQMAKSETSCLVRPLGIAASIVTIIQGLAWTVLASMKLSIENGAWEWKIETGTTYTKNLEATLYYMYLKKETDVENNNFYISPKELGIWAWIYLPVSLLWAFSSAALLWGLLHKQSKYVYKTMPVWVAFTAAISILDLILFSLLASDYSYIMDNFNETSVPVDDLRLYFFIVCGAVMTLAIRGYVLWILNVFFSVIMTKFIVDYLRSGVPEVLIKETATERQDDAPITAYDSSNIPADPWTNKSESTSYVGVENPNFVRSHSFNFPEVNGNDDNKRHGRYFDNNTNPDMPYIPEPDYTPPSTPKMRRPPLKSVLKQKSHYNNF